MLAAIRGVIRVVYEGTEIEAKDGDDLRVNPVHIVFCAAHGSGSTITLTDGTAIHTEMSPRDVDQECHKHLR